MWTNWFLPRLLCNTNNLSMWRSFPSSSLPVKWTIRWLGPGFRLNDCVHIKQYSPEVAGRRLCVSKCGSSLYQRPQYSGYSEIQILNEPDHLGSVFWPENFLPKKSLLQPDGAFILRRKPLWCCEIAAKFVQFSLANKVQLFWIASHQGHVGNVTLRTRVQNKVRSDRAHTPTSSPFQYPASAFYSARKWLPATASVTRSFFSFHRQH